MSDLEDYLQPFAGYIELGMYAEAEHELENIPDEMKAHPMVLLARLELLVATEQWDEGVIFGQTLCGLVPEELEFWFKTAFCLHELKRTAEARETLLSAPAPIRKTALFHYNLACYETQSGNLSEGRRLLNKSFEIDKRFREEARNDPDLKPLRES